MKKLKYFIGKGSGKAKGLLIATVAILVVCGIVMSITAHKSTNLALDQIPVVKTAAQMANEDIDELIPQEEKDKILEEIDKIDNSKLSKDEKEFVEVAEKTIEEFSLKNVTALFEKAENIAENLDDDNFEGYAEEIEEIRDVLDGQTQMLIDTINLVVKIILAGCIIAFLFTLLAVLFQSSTLAVFGMIFSALFTSCFAGMPFFILAVVLHITLIVMFVMLNKEYKSYKRAQVFEAPVE